MQVLDRDKERRKVAFHKGVQGFFAAMLIALMTGMILYAAYSAVYHVAFMKGYSCGLADEEYFQKSGGDLNGIGSCK